LQAPAFILQLLFIFKLTYFILNCIKYYILNQF